MEVIRQNIGNIAVGVIVFGALLLTVIRLVRNARKRKNGCGCGGCPGCG